MKHLCLLAIYTSSLFVSSVTIATSGAIEFSADAYVNAPQKTIKQSKIYVSHNAVRREMNVNGQNIIEIVFPQQGKAYLINQQLREYQERSFAPQDADQSKNPCSKIAHAKCEMIGTENIDGIKTEKWQIILNNDRNPVRTLHWLDVKRRLAIREFYPDGSMSELKLVKKEKINNRNTEKWKRQYSLPNGNSTDSFQWYDNELKISIREERPGGYMRELKNINVGKQDDSLFIVPERYRLINTSDKYR